MKTTTFWNVTPCSVAVGYQRSEATCCLDLYDKRWVGQVPPKRRYQATKHEEESRRISQSSEYAPGWTIRGSNSGRDKVYLFRSSSRPAPWSTQPAIQMVSAFFPESKEAGA